jgi:uncharacterized protein YggU (UPF0235/DUF167 family)
MPTLSFIFWHETWLSLIFWAEILSLVAAMIFHYVGQASVRRNPDDYVYHFSRVWWTTFRQKPSPISAPRMIDVDADEDGDKGPLMDLIDEDAIAALANPEAEPRRPRRAASDDDESEGEGDGGAVGTRVANLTVRVVTQQSNDEIVGWQGNALKIRVTAGAEGGQANKSVIELLASSLGLRPHQVQLKRGHYDEQKSFSIAGLTQAELDERLSSFE